MSYSLVLIKEAIRLRKTGLSYTEIRTLLRPRIALSTLSSWLKAIELDPGMSRVLKDNNRKKILANQHKAVQKNRSKREAFLNSLSEKNNIVSVKIDDVSTAKIALAMLCVGEASKHSSGHFTFGNSNPMIIETFLCLLKKVYRDKYDCRKVRCTVQCRADQDILELQKYWQKVTGVVENQFYRARVDRRSVGKITTKRSYKGVLRVDYFDTGIQLDLEDLAKLVYNRLR
ncbi:MAG: hypothetical protein ACD_22C00102G0003 [uncultured bacterium]|nr:MAG: hypothetical protein ACD_22C00102G0003 [uncultured bacterium]